MSSVDLHFMNILSRDVNAIHNVEFCFGGKEKIEYSLRVWTEENGDFKMIKHFANVGVIWL